MSRSRYFCAASAAVLLCAGVAQAQEARRVPAPAPKDSEVEEVVVTGTFIAGTPEDAAIPVEAITLEELRQQGSPSNLDLIKGMSETGSVAGEANRANLFAIGAQSINLRGISSSRTVVVFNGRRLAESYSFSVGRFNNVAQIPNAAIGRVETLKDGGATTYGADAVGGVVNYITRRDIDGIETNANYRYIKDSDGDYDFDLTAGKVGDNWNALVVLGYNHRSELDVADRDFALQPYLLNPSGWSGTGSPGAYVFQRASGATLATITPGATQASGNRFAGDVQIGATGIVRDPFCSAVGGFAGWSATPSPVCYFQSSILSNLVEEQETYQGYGEANYRFSDALKLHVEGLYYRTDIPHIPMDSFTNLPQNFPIVPGSPTGAPQLIGTSQAFVTPGHNPAVRQLLNSIRNSNGTLAFGDPNVAGTQANQIINGGRVGLVSGTWRPFGYGGHPLASELEEQDNSSQSFRLTAELSGDLPEVAGFRLNWLASVTANFGTASIKYNDMLVDRLQAALNGLGGPNCTGTTPGANGCMYFNPFSSGIQENVLTHQANPGFVGTGNFAGYAAGQGLQNNTDLIRWLYVPLQLKAKSEFTLYDLLLTGETPFKLWAEDPIAFAVGGQYRYYREEITLPDLADRMITPCATVGTQTCVVRTGPLVFSRGFNTSGLAFSQDRRYPVVSGFFEVRAPILNDLIASFSGRYEKFYSDVTPVNNDVFVMQGSAKWQITDWLAVRGTAGESFSQVDPPAPADPLVGANVNAPTAFGGNAVQFNTRNFPNLNVKPETGFNYNVGAIVQLGNFRANVDYYNIEINDLIRAQSTTQIINALVQPGQTGAGALINCQSELVTQNQPLFGDRPFVILNGPCVQGTSAINSPAGGGGLIGGTINFFGTQGGQTRLVNGGDLKTTGLDFSASYRFDDALGGQLTLNADWTYILTYKQSDYVVGGITVAPGFNGVGFLNDSPGRNNQHIAEHRGSFGFNFRRGRHNFNWTTRFVSDFVNENTQDFVELTAQNANIGPTVPAGAACVDTNPTSPPVPTGAGSGQFGTNTGAPATNIGFCAGQNVAVLTGMRVPWTWRTDISYQLTLPADTTLSVTIQNLMNEDPEFLRSSLGYDSLTGSPLGRTIRVGVRKRW
jgi:iron complex outermembrane recepter protein